MSNGCLPAERYEVEIAAWGPAFGYPEMPVFNGEQFADQGPEVPYEQRKTVVVSAAGHTRLGEILDEAAGRFGVLSQHTQSVSQQVHWVAFFRSGDELGMEYDYDRWHAALRTPDSAGNPSWAVAWSQITLDELLAARDAGLLDGDPLRVYFCPVIAQGTLADVASALWLTWTLWEHALAARETTGSASTVLHNMRRGKAAATDARDAWLAALQRPHELMAYLARVPRTTAEVVQHTGMREEPAEGALLSWGYALGPDARWRPGTRGAAAVLHQGLIDIKLRGGGPDVEAAADRVRVLVEKAEREQDAP